MELETYILTFGADIILYVLYRICVAKFIIKCKHIPTNEKGRITFTVKGHEITTYESNCKICGKRLFSAKGCIDDQPNYITTIELDG